MRASTLVAANPGLSLTRATQLVDGCNQAMLVGNINTVERCAMFLAQIGHESLSLRYQEEIGKGYGHEYYPYCGRTFIQVTWDYNYKNFGNWLHSKKIISDPNYFVKNPSKLADDRWAWLGAVWYWTVERPQLNTLSDNRDLYGATVAINGGLNGYEDRRDRYYACLRLGTAILPEDDKMNDSDRKWVVTQIITAMQSLMLGGTHGRWNPKDNEYWVKPEKFGVDDRLRHQNDRSDALRQDIDAVMKKLHM